MKSELCKIRRKARLWAGDAKVGRDRKSQSAADRRAMHGGDDRLFVAKDPHRLDIEVVDLAEAGGRIGLFARFGFLPRRVVKIGAGAERLALGREHRGA